MFSMKLNQDSLWRIGNIETGFRNYPAFAAYDIRSYVYDIDAGAHALEISRNGIAVNLWLFYPGMRGEINSIACYGTNLEGHYNAIRSSMRAFGMKVSSVSIEEGVERFVDIFIEEY